MTKHVAFIDADGLIVETREVATDDELAARIDAETAAYQAGLEAEIAALTDALDGKVAERRAELTGKLVLAVPEGQTAVDIPDGADWQPGGSYDGEDYAPPPPPSQDPADYPLNRLQFEAMALALGIGFAQIEQAIDQTGMTDFEKGVAKSRLKNATTYNRGHPLIAMLAPAFGIDDAAIDAAWMQAKDIR